MIERKKIGIDARFYGPIGKGLGRYTEEIVKAVVKLNPQYDFVVFLRRENLDLFNPETDNVKKVLADIEWYGLAEQLVMPWLIERERIDLMHFPHFNVPLLCPTRFIVTIHDLILMRFPTKRATTLGPLLYWIKNLAYRFVIGFAIRRSEKVISVSDFTKNDILSLFKISPDKIITTHLGVADSIRVRENDKNLDLGYNIGKPFLLYVGNAYPHKNLEKLIDIFANNKEISSNFRLVLVGKEDYFYKRLKETSSAVLGDNKDSVIFSGFVDDTELASMYRKCFAYIFPSLYEGFGLPPLEAMAHGAPVLSSDRTSMPEILGEAASYFDPTDSDDISAKILELRDTNLRSRLIEKGFMRAQQYDWGGTVRLTAGVYKQILGNK